MIQLSVPTKKSCASGYWFLGVKPGNYTVFEPPTDAVIELAAPVALMVEHATEYFSPEIPAGARHACPGLQTIAEYHTLTLSPSAP